MRRKASKRHQCLGLLTISYAKIKVEHEKLQIVPLTNFHYVYHSF